MLLLRVPDIICKKSRKLSSYDRKGAKAARFEVAMHGRSRNAAPRRSEVCNGFGLVLEECLRRRDLSWGFEQCNSKPAPMSAPSLCCSKACLGSFPDQVGRARWGTSVSLPTASHNLVFTMHPCSPRVSYNERAC